MSDLTRVMIIEDDLKIAELHRRYLEQMGGLKWLVLRPRKPTQKCN
ncbi:transcriptional regulatory protein CitB DpiA [Vibrio variabilis]|uniref:Transcriptional regulatory protein CitB DpiA n=1 Tax=Vibrio variabilis TaxID=990271 RepID=A0ABQ0JRJ5_9VIBR|nr:transcriptional regulatory protein CitB DpiA [Vibrio variabilis]